MLMSEDNIANFPKKYAEAAVVADLAANELIARLAFMTIEPKVVLDLGCGAGFLTQKLRERYPSAQVVGLDIDLDMLRYTSERAALQTICADALSLPMLANSIDLITANFLLPWLPHAHVLMAECQRILRSQGLLMMTLLGDQSLLSYPHQLALYDMHDLGDFILQKGLADPVLDINRYTLSYTDANKMFAELNASQIISQPFPLDEDKPYDIELEVIFAHAFMPERTNLVKAEKGETRIPVSVLRKGGVI